MNIHVKRTDYTLNSTISDLSINGEFFCYSLEDVVRATDAEKVHGKTAIPAGTYTVIISRSTRFKCLMPEVLNVPGFLGIRIHAGNTSADTEGCLILGKSKSKDFVATSRTTYNAFFAKLFDCHERGEKMTITIEDTKPSPIQKKKGK